MPHWKPGNDADRVEHCRLTLEEAFGPSKADLDAALASPPSMADVLAVLRLGADDVDDTAQGIGQLLADLRLDLHGALGTVGARVDQKLPADVRLSLEQLDRYVAELRRSLRQTVCDVRETAEGY